MVNYQKNKKFNGKFKNFSLLVIVLLTGCHMSKGIKTKAAINCDANTQKNTNPEVFYQQMIECINVGDDYKATLFYAKAGTLTWYQSLREPTEDNRLQHQNLAQKALGQLSENQIKLFSSTLEANLINLKSHENICSKIILPISTGDSDFSSELWRSAKHGYLHCT